MLEPSSPKESKAFSVGVHYSANENTLASSKGFLDPFAKGMAPTESDPTLGFYKDTAGPIGVEEE